MGVVVANIVFDSVEEVFDTLKGAPADGLLGDEPEPAFHLVEPGRIGWCEVDVERLMYFTGTLLTSSSLIPCKQVGFPQSSQEGADAPVVGAQVATTDP